MQRHRYYPRPRPPWLRTFFSVTILVVSALVALLVSQVVYRLLPHSYTATSSALVSSQPDVISAIIAGGARALSGAAASTDALVAPPTSGSLGSLWAILTSRQLLIRVAQKHDLAKELSLSDADAFEALNEMTRFTQIADVGFSVSVTCPGSPWGSGASLLSSPLTTERARNLSADLANSYLAELETYVTETNLRQAREMRKFLETSKQETQDRLHAIEQDLETLQSSHTFLDPQNKAQQLLERLKSVEPAYAQAAAHLEEAQQMYGTAKSQLGGVTAMRISQEVLARNPLITTLEQKLADLDLQLKTEQTGGKTDQHRDVIKLKAEIESTKQELLGIKEEVREQVSMQTNPAYDAAVSKVVDLETEVVGARARKAYYGRLRQEVHRDLAQLPSLARSYASLERERAQQTQLLDPLAQGLGLVELVEKYSSASRFIRLDTAVPPQRPSSTPVVASVISGLIVMLLGVGVFILYRRGVFGIMGT